MRWTWMTYLLYARMRLDACGLGGLDSTSTFWIPHHRRATTPRHHCVAPWPRTWRRTRTDALPAYHLRLFFFPLPTANSVNDSVKNMTAAALLPTAFQRRVRSANTALAPVCSTFHAHYGAALTFRYLAYAPPSTSAIMTPSVARHHNAVCGVCTLPLPVTALYLFLHLPSFGPAHWLDLHAPLDIACRTRHKRQATCSAICL